MKQSKESDRSSVAEKAIRRAIDEETAGLQATVRQRDAEIVRLRTLLSNIAQVASKAEVVVQMPPAQFLPRVDEPVVPAGPVVKLADEDEMGDGRWA